ncbi:GNAT family N-acetyltransferase [Dasania marina]|uniref:GNAT family N-acetyltransferase n=1 Tax=Dasania marina TaxID=471499 RepID=UPI00037A655F|nr:GNAT family N-acetyltransferase [Dasania marina]
MELPKIETKRLLLREIAESDLDHIYAIYSNPSVIRYTGDTLWTEKEEAVEFIEGAHEGLEEESLFGWCVELKETKRVIGTCALFDCELEKRVAEISYEILPDYWRQGLTSELLPPLIEFGFKALDLNRINAFADSRNTASIKLLTSNHFKNEGLMRESWIDSDGCPVDEHVMGLLQREWLA